MQKNGSVVLLLLLCSTLKWDRQDKEMGDWNDDNHWTSFRHRRRRRQFTNFQKQKHSFPAHLFLFDLIVVAIYTTYTVGLCRISVPKEQRAKKTKKTKTSEA